MAVKKVRRWRQNLAPLSTFPPQVAYRHFRTRYRITDEPIPHRKRAWAIWEPTPRTWSEPCREDKNCHRDLLFSLKWCPTGNAASTTAVEPVGVRSMASAPLCQFRIRRSSGLFIAKPAILQAIPSVPPPLIAPFASIRR